MAEYLIQDSTLTDIANAIRGKTSGSDAIKANEMASQIDSIDVEEYNITVTVDSGATVTATCGSKSVQGTSNGTCILKVHDVGDWVVTSTLDGAESTTRTVGVFNNFSTTLVFFTAPVNVNTSEGAVVTAVKDNITLTQTAGSNGVCNFVIRDPGSWVFTAVKGDKTMTETVSIVEEKTYTIYFAIDIDMLTLNSNSWETISEISAAGTARNYWAVGDCKAVKLAGTMGTLELDTTLWVYILGFDHNKDVEGSGIQFGGFKTNSGSSGINVSLVDSKYNSSATYGTKYFNMNHWYYNYGGWARCDMRYDILGSTDVAPQGYGTAPSSGQVGYAPSEACATNPVSGTLMSCLPAELRAVMKPITKYTDNVGGGTNVETNVSTMQDYLPLLAEFEIFGARTYANSYEQNHQAQYEYYSAGNSKIKKRHDSTGTSAIWWERSPYYSNNRYFCRVYTNGGADYTFANFSYGVAPAFMV